MRGRKLLKDFGHAISVFVELDEDGFVEPWDRRALFQLDKPVEHLWKQLPCADNPPRAYALMSRKDGEETIYDLLWAVEDTAPEAWPVVEVSTSGDCQVLAMNAEDYVDAMLYSAGTHGGASEDDLEDAREEAVPEALVLAEQIGDDLDRDLADPEALGERWDEAQELFGDAWADAVEGIEG